MPITHPSQSVLIAVGRSDGIFDGATALAAQGEVATLAIEETDSWPGHFMPAEFEHVPREPGLHVWEGSIVETTPSDPEATPELRWEGDWRPATLGDFGRFGLAVPKGVENASV